MKPKRTILGLFLLAVAAQAGPLYYTSYQVLLDPGTASINGIVKFEETAGGGGGSWPDFLHPGDGEWIQTIDQIFPTGTPRTRALLMGLAFHYEDDAEWFPVLDLVTGAPPEGATAHLVLFADTGFSLAVQGEAFSTLFPGYLEEDVVNWLAVVGLLGVNGVGEEEFNHSFDSLAGFAESLKSVETAEGARSAWFSIPENQTVGPTNFDVLQFSYAMRAGTGQAVQTMVAGATAPEPGTFVMFGFGLALGGLVRLRR